MQRGDLCRRRVDHRLCAAEESLGRIHVAGGAEHRVHEFAVAVNGPVQITPLAFNLYVRLVYVPAATDSPLPFAAHMLSQQRSEPFLPFPHGFVRELESSQQKHLGDVAEAQLVPQSAQNDLEDDVCWQLKEVEWGARSLIGFTPTRPTAKYRVSEFRAAVQVPQFGRLTMRTDHGR